MKTTMDLLSAALEAHPMPYWAKKLDLSRNALHSSKQRGNLSPAIAGALAEELGEDVDSWIVTAALESERDSACKRRMLSRARNKKAPERTQRLDVGGNGRFRRNQPKCKPGYHRVFCCHQGYALGHETCNHPRYCSGTVLTNPTDRENQIKT